MVRTSVRGPKVPRVPHFLPSVFFFLFRFPAEFWCAKPWGRGRKFVSI